MTAATVAAAVRGESWDGREHQDGRRQGRGPEPFKRTPG
jgi:hypothetical protein